MKNKVPASQINLNFSSKVILPYNRSNTLSKALSAATSFVDVPDSSSMPDQPLPFKLLGLVDFYRRAASRARVRRPPSFLLLCAAAACACGSRARVFCNKATPAVCSFLLRGSGCTAVARSTDVLQGRLHKRAITSYRFARRRSRRCGGVVPTKKTGSMSSDAVQAVPSGPTGSEETLSRFPFCRACASGM